MYIVSATRWTEEKPTDRGYFESQSIDDVCDAVRSILESDDGVTDIHISIEPDYQTEVYPNDYE